MRAGRPTGSPAAILIPDSRGNRQASRAAETPLTISYDRQGKTGQADGFAGEKNRTWERLGRAAGHHVAVVPAERNDSRTLQLAAVGESIQAACIDLLEDYNGSSL